MNLHTLKQMLKQTIDLDRTFHVLADKSRRTMVERLTSGPASVSELAEASGRCPLLRSSNTCRYSKRAGL